MCLILFGFSYVVSALLCVTLDGQILIYRWVIILDVTKRVVSVTKSIRVNHNPILKLGRKKGGMSLERRNVKRISVISV